MEKLTFDGNFCDIAQCRELPCPYNNNCTQRQVWERLKKYEDSGLSPIACEEAKKIEDGLSEHDYSIARMVELMQADKDGRVVVLPCKVGDTVYRLQYVEESLGRFIVDAVPIKFALIWFDEFGKTVFLTREEAKKELEVIKHG
nr:MAG TPA: hypothetical protein [Caudoviricetes sp.]